MLAYLLGVVSRSDLALLDAEGRALMDSSVVIPNLNGAHFLEPCLTSLGTADAAAVEVDRRGQRLDGRLGRARPRAVPAGYAADLRGEPRLRRRDERRYRRRHGAELVAFLNNDAVAEPGWLEELAACLERHPGGGRSDVQAPV